ncbi:MAG: hypothetical protein M5R36_08975 [Deltaproteobacteria bacterium]|nr:hypothetical protein [Deltaproteobacteria bacterium]
MPRTFFALPRAEPPFTAWPDALGAFDAGDAVGVRGPLTDAIATDLMKRAPGKTIFIEDATKIFCDEPVYRKLVGACGGIFVARSFDLRLLAANPTARGRAGFDPPSFAAALKRAAPLLPVIDVVAEIAL